MDEQKLQDYRGKGYVSKDEVIQQLIANGFNPVRVQGLLAQVHDNDNWLYKADIRGLDAVLNCIAYKDNSPAQWTGTISISRSDLQGLNTLTEKLSRSESPFSLRSIMDCPRRYPNRIEVGVCTFDKATNKLHVPLTAEGNVHFMRRFKGWAIPGSNELVSLSKLLSMIKQHLNPDINELEEIFQACPESDTFQYLLTKTESHDYRVECHMDVAGSATDIVNLTVSVNNMIDAVNRALDKHFRMPWIVRNYDEVSPAPDKNEPNTPDPNATVSKLYEKAFAEFVKNFVCSHAATAIPFGGGSTSKFEITQPDGSKIIFGATVEHIKEVG